MRRLDGRSSTVERLPTDVRVFLRQLRRDLADRDANHAIVHDRLSHLRKGRVAAIVEPGAF